MTATDVGDEFSQSTRDRSSLKAQQHIDSWAEIYDSGISTCSAMCGGFYVQHPFELYLHCVSRQG